MYEVPDKLMQELFILINNSCPVGIKIGEISRVLSAVHNTKKALPEAPAAAPVDEDPPGADKVPDREERRNNG